MAESLAGQLLLASPTLLDPNFARTVVLIGVHDELSAMGVVLNRPTELTVGEAVPALTSAVEETERVYVGGPVAQRSVVCLAEFTDPACAELLVVGRIGFPMAGVAPEELAAATGRWRVFAGYAGWGEGQLEGEIERGDWISELATPDDVFSDDAEALWSSALARKGGSYALLARLPADPSSN